MSEYRIVTGVLPGSLDPVHFLDKKCGSRWENIKNSKNRNILLMMLEHERRREQQMGEEKFWMVLRKSGNSAPSVRHNRKSDAVTEAQRLARQSMEDYYILEVIGKVKPVRIPVEYEEI